jgi:translation initiation factor 3 subunit A
VINIAVAETLQMHAATRFVQMDVALELQLWQEAFKTAEDIHGLLVLSKKAIKPASMARFYQRLSQLFWLSDNQLFHAAALHRLFALTRAHNRALTDDDVRKCVGPLVRLSGSVV